MKIIWACENIRKECYMLSLFSHLPSYAFQLDGFLLWTRGILMFLFWVWSQRTIDIFLYTNLWLQTNKWYMHWFLLQKSWHKQTKINSLVMLLVSCSPYYFPTCHTADGGCSHCLANDPGYIYYESYTEKSFILLQRIKELNPRVMTPPQSEIWHWLLYITP